MKKFALLTILLVPTSMQALSWNDWWKFLHIPFVSGIVYGAVKSNQRSNESFGLIEKEVGLEKIEETRREAYFLNNPVIEKHESKVTTTYGAKWDRDKSSTQRKNVSFSINWDSFAEREVKNVHALRKIRELNKSRDRHNLLMFASIVFEAVLISAHLANNAPR